MYVKIKGQNPVFVNVTNKDVYALFDGNLRFEDRQSWVCYDFEQDVALRNAVFDIVTDEIMYGLCDWVEIDVPKKTMRMKTRAEENSDSRFELWKYSDDEKKFVLQSFFEKCVARASLKMINELMVL